MIIYIRMSKSKSRLKPEQQIDDTHFTDIGPISPRRAKSPHLTVFKSIKLNQ